MNKNNHRYLVKYIARLMDAECPPAHRAARDLDIAKAIQIAGQYGFEKLHQYMGLLCQYAEDGRYTCPSFEMVVDHLELVLKNESTLG